MSDEQRKVEVATAASEVEMSEAAVDAVFVCLDVSGSIRGGDVIYPKWVADDVKKVFGGPEPSANVRWVLWGSSAEPRDSLGQVVEYLEDSDCLGGTEPLRFVELLPSRGVIDLHVYTDGEIGEWDVRSARDQLDLKPDLRVRRVVINYVNKNLDHMNVGLSAIFDGYVLEMHGTRVADGKKVHQFDAAPLEATVSVRDIVDEHLALGKTEAEMTKGIHYLAQRFANATAKTRQEIRRLVRERADAVNREFRTKVLSPEEEAALLAAVDALQWQDARKPFVGHAVPDSVKLVQAYCQKFLNETKQGALVRISAYAPLLLRGKGSGGDQFDEHEDVLLDHIMYLGLGKDAVVVVPVTLSSKEDPPARGQPRVRDNHIKCALKFDVKVNFDNTFGLDTLFQLRDQQRTDRDANEGHVLDQLSARAHGEPAVEAAALSSSAHSFGVNPFTRQPMECVLLVPAAAHALPADRLGELDAWNAHMMSRFVRSGRTMPSVALTLALVLERAFVAWDEPSRPEDRAQADRLKAVCRQYVGRMATPLTFTVGMPVVIQGAFSTAARLACGVLQGALDPALPLDVLTQFWASVPDAEDAAQVWAALSAYAGEARPFPEAQHRSLLALVAGVQYARSARDAKLRAKKGLAYSLRAYLKRLDQLAARGCDRQRLRDEERAVRQDVLGVARTEVLACAHGVDPETCVTLAPEHEEVDVICHATCRPTLLNPRTMDMWYVGQPLEPSALARQSFHKAMCQLVRKRTKGKTPRHEDFPPKEEAFADFVSQRVRAAHLDPSGKGDFSSGRLLPTDPCARLRQDVQLSFSSYSRLVDEVPGLSRERFVQALAAAREVCSTGPCCEFIRRAVTPAQRRWIDAHATHAQVAGCEDVLSGRVSYRQA